MKSLLKFVTDNKFNVIDVTTLIWASEEIANTNYIKGICIFIGGILLSAILVVVS